MDKKPTQLDLPNPVLNAEPIILDWVKAATAFERNYTQLINCLSKSEIGQNEYRKSTTYIGQCPLAPLIKLVATMKTELERLVQDTDTLNQATTRERYKQLIRHTRTLTKLNDQAHTRLHLMTQPVS